MDRDFILVDDNPEAIEIMRVRLAASEPEIRGLPSEAPPSSGPSNPIR